MHDLNLRSLGFRLLRAGVAPKHVKRTLTELEDHFTDLRQMAVDEGMSPVEATERALEQLGGQEQIIEATLARLELRSWAYRWPWGMYGVLPVFVMALTIVASVVACVGLLGIAENLSGLDAAAFGHALNDQSWARTLLVAWTIGTVHVLPVAGAVLVCVTAARRDAPVIWPAVGVFLILSLGFCFDFSFVPPLEPDGQAAITAGLGFSTDSLLDVRVLRLLLPLALVLIPYYFWRSRQSAVVSAS